MKVSQMDIAASAAAALPKKAADIGHGYINIIITSFKILCEKGICFTTHFPNGKDPLTTELAFCF